MIKELIKKLIAALPRFAEEEGDYSVADKTDLVTFLEEASGVSREVAENTLELCESLLDTMALLDQTCLQKGEWCFVSFPAQLMALSILSAIADSESRFFSLDFWNTRDINDIKKDKQREVLKTIESYRCKNHEKQMAEPVRYIHVAWGIIKWKNKILLHRREDHVRRSRKEGLGDYTIVGGRVNQKDMGYLDEDMRIKLQVLQSGESEKMSKAYENCLIREVEEETGLSYEAGLTSENQQYYHFNEWKSLKPYRQIEGAKNNHALTEYRIVIYNIKLTLEGFCALSKKIDSDKIDKDERLVWFTLDEVIKGVTEDGKKAYLNALYDEHSKDKERLETDLSELKDSFKDDCRDNIDNNYNIQFKNPEAQTINAGIRGKEKDYPLKIEKDEYSLLLGLVVHRREFDFSENDNAVKLHPFGWIEFEDGSELQKKMLQLYEAVKDSDNELNELFENQKDRWFRLSISPEKLFLDDGLFKIHVKKTGEKFVFIVQRSEIDTGIGKVKYKESDPVGGSVYLANAIQGEHEGSFDLYRKSDLHNTAQNMGLRTVINKNADKVCDIHSENQ